MSMKRDSTKMIIIEVRLWTNKLGKGGKVKPKHAWSGGTVNLRQNELHDIEVRRPLTFNSLLDLGRTLERVLVRGGITLHKSRSMKRYVV